MPDVEAGTEHPEHDVLRTKIHWGILLIPVLLGIPLAVLFFLPTVVIRYVLVQATGQAPPILFWGPAAALLIFLTPLSLGALIAFMDTEYVLTTRRLRFRTGVLLRASGEMLLQDIEAILLVEPLPGQIFGWGTVAVVGKGGSQFPLRFIPEVRRFHARLQEAREAVRTGRPLSLSPAHPPGSIAPTPLTQPPKGLASLATESTSGHGAADPAPLGRLEKAWQELNRPLPDDPKDDSRYMPKA